MVRWAVLGKYNRNSLVLSLKTKMVRVPFLKSCVQSLLAYALLFHFVFIANLSNSSRCLDYRKA